MTEDGAEGQRDSKKWCMEESAVVVGRNKPTGLGHTGQDLGSLSRKDSSSIP